MFGDLFGNMEEKQKELRKQLADITVEAEDGTWTAFQTLVGTLVVTVVVSLALAHHVVTEWFFRYPELLGIVLALNLLLGRYTGYRISELYRFHLK